MKKKLFKTLSGLLVATALIITSVLPAFAYEVQPGDTLSKIAKENGTTVNALVEANNLEDANKLFVGQNLNISNESKKPTLPLADRKLLKSMFDAEWYEKAYPDVVAVLGDSYNALFNHFLEYGLYETRQPNKDFNVNVYFSAYKDLQVVFGEEDNVSRILDLYRHYDKYGKAEKREITSYEKMVATAPVSVIYSAAEPTVVISESANTNSKSITEEKETKNTDPTPVPTPVKNEVDVIAEEYFKEAVELYKSYAVKFNLPEKYLNKLNSLTIDTYNQITMTEFLNAIESNTDREEAETAFETLRANLSAKMLKTEDAKKLVAYVNSLPIHMTYEEYANPNHYDEDYFSYHGYINKNGQFGLSPKRAMSVSIYAANEWGVWKVTEPEQPAVSVEPVREGYETEEEYTMALNQYLYDSEVYNDWVIDHEEWLNSEPKEEDYFMANFDNEEEAMAAKEEYQASIPTKEEYKAYMNSLKNSYLTYFTQVTGNYKYELSADLIGGVVEATTVPQ